MNEFHEILLHGDAWTQRNDTCEYLVKNLIVKKFKVGGIERSSKEYEIDKANEVIIWKSKHPPLNASIEVGIKSVRKIIWLPLLGAVILTGVLLFYLGRINNPLDPIMFGLEEENKRLKSDSTELEKTILRLENDTIRLQGIIRNCRLNSSSEPVDSILRILNDSIAKLTVKFDNAKNELNTCNIRKKKLERQKTYLEDRLGQNSTIPPQTTPDFSEFKVEIICKQSTWVNGNNDLSNIKKELKKLVLNL